MRIKRLVFVLIIVLVMSISACTSTPSDSDTTVDTANMVNANVAALKVDDVSMLELPGIKWGASPEEVKTALNLTNEQVVLDKTHGEEVRVLYITDVDFFDKEISLGVFTFHRYLPKEEYGLNKVYLYYPDETDMTVLRDTLSTVYGAPKDGLGFTRYRVSGGKIESYTDAGIGLGKYEGQTTQIVNWWESTAKQGDMFSAEIRQSIMESGILSFAGDRVDPADPSSHDLVVEFLAKQPAAFLLCTDSAKVISNASLNYTKNVVWFDASAYMAQLEYHSK